jgi:hypothetical protein
MKILIDIPVKLVSVYSWNGCGSPEGHILVIDIYKDSSLLVFIHIPDIRLLQKVSHDFPQQYYSQS